MSLEFFAENNDTHKRIRRVIGTPEGRAEWLLKLIAEQLTDLLYEIKRANEHRGLY